MESLYIEISMTFCTNPSHINATQCYISIVTQSTGELLPYTSSFNDFLGSGNSPGTIQCGNIQTTCNIFSEKLVLDSGKTKCSRVCAVCIFHYRFLQHYVRLLFTASKTIVPAGNTDGEKTKGQVPLEKKWCTLIRFKVF